MKVIMLFSFFRLFVVLAAFSNLPLFAEEASEKDSKKEETAYKLEEISRQKQTLSLNGQVLNYESICGTLPLKGNEDKTKAVMYYTAYFKKASAEETKARPVLFCFNGGPGSSSLWLHMGLLGPKKVVIQDAGYTPPPASYENNPYTLLDKADLVFIDPVSTGYSKPTPETDAKQFHSVEGDIDSFAEFIRTFLTHFQRWGSPRYLFGESYGTIRAVGLANRLHDDYLIDINGLILVSMLLDFQTYDFGNGNDLPYVLNLPTYSACAWYHKKLPQPQQSKTLPELMAEVESFALHEYSTALLQGDSIDPKTADEITNRLVQYTGLSPEFIRASHLRILNFNFFHELLRKETKVIGRFDGRYVAYDSNHSEEPFILPDPSFDSVTGPFTSAFQQYLANELKVEKTDPYLVLNADVVFPWNFSVNRIPAGMGYLYMSGKLRTLLEKTPTLKVFVASGYYDLATPYFAANYSLNHLKLDPTLSRNIKEHRYGAGHMMYLNRAVHEQMKQDLSAFLSNKG